MSATYPPTHPPIQIDSTLTITVEQMKDALTEYLPRQGIIVLDVKRITEVFADQRNEMTSGYKLNVDLGGRPVPTVNYRGEKSEFGER